MIKNELIFTNLNKNDSGRIITNQKSYDIIIADNEKKIFNDFLYTKQITNTTSNSIIYKGLQVGSNKNIIIKKIKCEGLNENKEPIENRLANELTLLSNFIHPGLVKINQIYYTNNYLYILQPYYIGGDLFNLISENIILYKQLNEYKISELFLQIILAVQFLHKNNIVHRDIKLENIFVSSHNINDMHLILGDFGMSTIWENYKWKYSSIGTLPYASPEILKGCYKGPEIDIWSLGVTLYAFCIGKLPFYDDNDNILKIKIQNCDYKIPDGVSASFIDLFKGMCEIDVHKRLTIEQIILHPWFRLNGKRNSINISNYDDVNISWEEYLSSGLNNNSIDIIDDNQKTSRNISPLRENGSKWSELLKTIKYSNDNLYLYENLISLPLNTYEWEVNDVIIWLNLHNLQELQYIFALMKINGEKLLNINSISILDIKKNNKINDENIYIKLLNEIEILKEYHIKNKDKKIKILLPNGKKLDFQIFDIHKLKRNDLKKIINLDEPYILTTLKYKKNKLIYTIIKSSKDLRKLIKKNWNNNKEVIIHIIYNYQ